MFERRGSDGLGGTDTSQLLSDHMEALKSLRQTGEWEGEDKEERSQVTRVTRNRSVGNTMNMKAPGVACGAVCGRGLAPAKTFNRCRLS